MPGANGSDGALLITTNTEINRGAAVTGPWTTSNTGANVGRGVYDPEKWAVVFKYTSVTINPGATLTFKNNITRAPVVWLVSGDVTINGTVSLDGANGAVAPALAEPGPGGFRGGQGVSGGIRAGSGLGPGGALKETNNNGTTEGDVGFGGSYGTVGGGGPAIVGNPSLLPLVGGSGGGGDANEIHGGGAGGGALLIACANTVTINGEIRANGGSRNPANNSSDSSGGGSGGGLRILANSLAGTGRLNAVGGTGGSWQAVNGGSGRIRIERVVNTNSLLVTPSPSVVPLVDGATALLWPPATAPQVEVVSIGGNAAPADPKASFGTHGPDLVVGQVTTTPIVIRTTNVEQASQVIVRVTPRNTTNYTETTANFGNVVSTNPLVINWNANLPVQVGNSAVIVRVVRP